MREGYFWKLNLNRQVIEHFEIYTLRQTTTYWRLVYIYFHIKRLVISSLRVYIKTLFIIN